MVKGIRRTALAAAAVFLMISITCCGAKQRDGQDGQVPQATPAEESADHPATDSTSNDSAKDAPENSPSDASAENGGGTATSMDPTEDLIDSSNYGNFPGSETAIVGGPYGRIMVEVPSNWVWEAFPVDEEGLMFGLYGLILKPERAKEGQIELICTDSFGVCGTGLSQREIMLAGGTATVGTYDDHENWDYIVFGTDDADAGDVQTAADDRAVLAGKGQIVAQHAGCEIWTMELWEETLLILNTVRFDRSVTEGGVGRYIPESENDEIAVAMDVHHVTPSGAVVRFRQYDSRDTGDLIFGEGYVLEELGGNGWEPLPTVVGNGAFHDEGFILMPEEDAEIETDWEWLYGELSPGLYRIRKTVIDSRDAGYKEYTLYAAFLIAGS